MIEEAYVSFETARLLKEKGFDINTDTSYVVDNTNRPAVKVGDFLHNMPRNEKHLIAAPTQALAMRWLREVHNLHIDIDVSEGDWNPCVIELEDWSVVSEYDTEKTQDTYENAVEYALKYCLTNLI